MEELKHFSHHHLLYLVHLQQTHIIQNSPSSDDNEEDDEEDDDDLQVVVQEDDQQQHGGGQCKMCEEWIYSFHLCYYKCHQCDYSLHKFCAELPITLESHPLHDHPGHELTLSKEYQLTESDPDLNPTADRFDEYTWLCAICKVKHKMFFNYHCSICKFTMDIVCATMSQQKMDHPSHPHQLERMFKSSTLAACEACGNEHKGTFYHYTICSWFWIHVDCASMPTKLSIQQSTKGSFTHSHFLTLAYSFPYIEKKARFFPLCKVCDRAFDSEEWLYKCDKCLYYVHFECGASKREPFMSIFLHAGLGKTFKNFKDDDHPNLLHCPFPDESCNLLKHYFYNRREFFVREKDDNRLINHFSHPHPLILFDTQASLCNKSISLHDPMKKIQVLCDGCIKPITSVPFYKCSQYNVENCGFVLHEWCAKLPSEVHDHPGHPEHTLVLQPKILGKLLGVFYCEVCRLPSNGFAYGCTKCEYYVDINCSLIPEEITHEGHPNHLLFRVKDANMPSTTYCWACNFYIGKRSWGFHCPACNFYLHTRCALLLPGEVRHKKDKHPLSLRYGPVENHPEEYFCEICEDGMIYIGHQWFYHCTTCAWSMHAACVPLILQSEQAVYSKYKKCVFEFINVKFGGKVEMKSRHPHSVAFVQGIESHGQCNVCDNQLQYNMIFKCLECDQFAIHYQCAGSLAD